MYSMKKINKKIKKYKLYQDISRKLLAFTTYYMSKDYIQLPLNAG